MKGNYKNMKAKTSKVIHILGVCGAGTVTSTMLAMRVEEVLEEEGIRSVIDEIRPTQVHSTLETAKVDMIITSSPIPDVEKITVPGDQRPLAAQRFWRSGDYRRDPQDCLENR
jgi:Phosphotransferase system, galactitol-specific IIB component